jgi:hypothetical protein
MFDADIRKINVAIDDVRDELAHLAPPQFVGSQNHRLKIQARGVAQMVAFPPGQFVTIKSASQYPSNFRSDAIEKVHHIALRAISF